MKKYITAVLSGLLLSASAHAATVTYNYTASVYLIYNYDYTRPFPLSPGSITLSDGSVGIGDVYHGQFTYDTATPLHTNPNDYDPTYSGAAPLNASTAQFASGVTFASTPGAAQSSIGLFDNNPYLHDYLTLSAYADGDVGERSMTFNFATDNESALNGMTIPGSLNAFGSRFIYFSGRISPTSTYTIMANIDSLTPAGTAVTAVPEPETYAMLLAGIGLVGWSASRRQKPVAAN